MTYTWLKDLDKAAKKSGLKVVTISGWSTRGRPASVGQFNPKGVVAHHTGDRATGAGVASGILSKGRSGLPGPLCQLGLDKDGTVYVIAAGRANHAGTVRRTGFMSAGDGNSQAIGIEAFNSGSEGWTAKQLGAYHRLVAALCDHYGWSRGNVVGHGECSTAGKWDPGIRAGKMMDMNEFRRAVKAVDLKDSKPVPEKPKVLLSDWSPDDFGPGKSGPQITLLDKRLIAHGFTGAEKDPTVWSADLQRRVQRAQRAQGFSGNGADGLPGHLTLVWLTKAPATPVEPKPPVVVPPVTGAPTYVVRPGDTAYSIAKAHGIAVADLAKWNGLADPTLITPGMVLKVKPTPIPPLDPDEEPEVPKPTAGKKVRLRAATGNVNVYWKGGWGGRVDDVARVLKKGSPSIVGLCEMSTGAAGGLMVKHLGWGDASNQVDSHKEPRSRDSYDVHGGPHAGVRIFAGWDPDKRRVLEVREFKTVGDRNSRAIAVLLQDRETGVLSVWAWTHLEFEPQGANKKGHWGNDRRQAQLDSTMKQAKAFAAEAAKEHRVEWVPTFVGGDMNGDKDDPEDGPGIAAKKHGFVDADTVAEKKINGTKTTHAKKPWKNGYRIDRWFVEKGVRVLESETLNMYPHSDHNAVVIYVEFSNEKP